MAPTSTGATGIQSGTVTHAVPSIRSGSQYRLAATAVNSERFRFKVRRTRRQWSASSVGASPALVASSGSGSNPNVSGGRSIASANRRSWVTSWHRRVPLTYFDTSVRSTPRTAAISLCVATS
jgi:hypothetical protein